MALCFGGFSIVFESYFGLMSLVWFVIQVILFACLTTGISFLLSKNLINIRTHFLRNSLFFTAILGFFTALFTGFIAYHNIVPGKLSDIVLTRSGQTVHFLQMAHIADHSFYEEKQKQIQEFQKNKFIFLVEWVRPGSVENQQKFEAYMGFRFTETLYEKISALLWLSFQDNEFLFRDIPKSSLRSVDISIDDIALGLPSTLSWEILSPPVDIEQEILLTSSNLNSQERIFLSYVARGVMNFALKRDSLHLVEQSLSAPLIDGILEKRDHNVVEYISTHSWQNIVVVYGALHFPGVLSWLRENDPNWKIDRFTPSFPYRKN